MPKRYRALLLDCFNTVLIPDPFRLPQMELDGKKITSTAPVLVERLAPRFPRLRADTVHRAARAAWRWAEGQRGPEFKEIPAPVRFARLAAELGFDDPDGALAAELLAIHMAAVMDSYVLPPAHKKVLEFLRKSHRLALFSNFDHRPALQTMLEAAGIATWFDPLIISDGLGFRKPGHEAFSRALALLGEDPPRVLMVGDSLTDDVAGALEAGIDVAWINPRGESPSAPTAPTYHLKDLPALAGLLKPDQPTPS